MRSGASATPMTILQPDAVSDPAIMPPIAGTPDAMQAVSSPLGQWLRRYGPLLFAAICLAVGSLLLWHRGFYQDDYFDFNLPIRLDASMSNGARFLSALTSRSLAKLLEDSEFVVRVITAGFVGVNAFLVGALVQRILRSRMAGLIALWLFVNPALGYESVLWLAAASIYVYAVTFALLFLHAAYSFLSQEKASGRWFAAAVVAYLLALNASETMVGILLMAPALALLVVLQKDSARWSSGRGSSTTRRIAIRAGLLLALPIALTAVYFVAFYLSNPFIQSARGSFDLNPVTLLDRAYRSYFVHLYFITASPEFGATLWSDSFMLGLRALISPAGLVLGGAAIVLLAGVVLAWQPEPRQVRWRVGLVLAATGLLWAILLMVVPGVFVTKVQLTSRVLYLPFAGLAVLVAAAVWLLPARWQRAGLLASGGLAILLTIWMLGWASVYNARYRLDKAQLDALTQNVPMDLLPPGTLIIPYRLDEISLPDASGSMNSALTGVFEAPTGAIGSLIYATGRIDIDPVTVNYRWIAGTGLSCTTLELLRESKICMGDGAVQNDPVPTASSLLFTYRQGQFFVIKSLRFFRDAPYTVHFPLAAMLAANGVPALEIVYD
ncbi:MAG: hypothetical protein IPK19_29380 [Chloroflexi bacterium]|nr:hypothetical protein [Chloroflexota bacterium]